MSNKALCIGINDYPGTDSDLQGCVNDASDWSAELTGRGYAVSRLTDAQATKAAMVAAMRGLIGGAQSGDSLVITYSGHGTWVPDSSGDEPDGRDEGLCPYDVKTAGPLLDDEIRVLFAARGRGGAAGPDLRQLPLRVRHPGAGGRPRQQRPAGRLPAAGGVDARG